MKLGDKNCYPLVLEDNGNAKEFSSGLTFRERLIVALASNSSMVTTADETAEGGSIGIHLKYIEDNVVNIIAQADAIIKQLESEATK